MKIAFASNASNACSEVTEILEENHFQEAYIAYVKSLTVNHEPPSAISMEHSYALTCGDAPTSAPDARLLLVRRPPLCPGCHDPTDDDENIDVETVEAEPTPPLLMDELPSTEKALEPGQLVPEADDTKPDWEQKLYSIAWDQTQMMLIEETLKIVFSARAALLGSGLKGTRRAACRGIAGRSMRALLASPSVRWQPRLVQWLHNAMSEYLTPPLLAVYREILLTLKSKIPSLIEKMTLGHPLMGRIRGAENGGSGGPTIASGNPIPVDPTAPFLILLPSGRDKKDARWAERLRTVAQVHQVHSHQSTWPTTLPIPACLSQLVGSGRSKANSLKAENPHRPLVLVGHGAGAAIAIQLAVTISDVAGVVCLGLPLLTAEGPRGSPDDCLLELNCPVLFVIGQNSPHSCQEDTESLRSKLRCRSRLLVVGGADEHLRVPRLRRHLEGVTQRMVECAIAEEVGNFLSSLSQWEEEGDGRSTPDSIIDEQEIERAIPSTILTHPPVKRRFPETSLYQRTKKMKNKPIKSTSPLKGRGVALYQINNPPPEGTKISMGQLLSTKIGEEEFMPDSGNSLSPPSIKTENASFVQISNNRLTKAIPLSGNGSSTDKLGNTGIKVLENIPFKMTKMTTTGSPRVLGSLSASANTPILLPRKAASTNVQTPEQTTSSLNSTNIMDIPIIFADDDKVGEKQQSHPVMSQITSVGGMKTIIFNKPQIANQSQKTIDSSQIGQTSGNIIKLRMSQNTQGGTQVGANAQGKLGNTNTVKYAKFIVTKRADPLKPDVSESGKSPIVSKPIFVTGKGQPLTVKGQPLTVKLLSGGMFQKAALGQNKQLILKRNPSPVVISSGISNADPGRKKSDLLVNSNSDRAIEAAVASITGDQDNQGDMSL